MLRALISGKLPAIARGSEDVLTSNVFGTLELMPVAEVADALRFARTQSDEFPLRDLRRISEVRFDFWPWYGDRGGGGAEPDLVIDFRRADASLAARVLIEAKFRSGKSPYAPADDEAPLTPEETVALEDAERREVRDQLAREWVNLVAQKEKPERVVLVYLTKHHVPPWQDLVDTQSELHKQGHGDACLAWMSWRHLHEWARTKSSRGHALIEQGLRTLSLTGFHGLQAPTTTYVPYRYVGHFRWQPHVARVAWQFSQQFNLVTEAPAQPWRFVETEQ